MGLLRGDWAARSPLERAVARRDRAAFCAVVGLVVLLVGVASTRGLAVWAGGVLAVLGIVALGAQWRAVRRLRRAARSSESREIARAD